MIGDINIQTKADSQAFKAISNITGIIEKYTDQVNLLHIIDIVDNLRILAEMAEGCCKNTKTSTA
ncbi:MAG: hypothetical protein ACOY31_10160 [Bacillota bacterium]